MPPTFALLLGIAIGLLIAHVFSSRRFGGGQAPKIAKIVQERSSQKESNKRKIITYLKEHGSITNDGVEELLGVGNTAAYNYLEELEQEGVIRQVGKTGKHVKYTLR